MALYIPGQKPQKMNFIRKILKISGRKYKPGALLHICHSDRKNKKII